MRNLNHVTYASFGINPKSFYAGKFAGGAAPYDFLALPRNKFHIEYDRARFLCSEVTGPDVLDIGCGSGPYSATLRANTNVKRLVGVDLDPTCVDIAAAHYDAATVFDLNEPLPFPDHSFDCVFSVDVMGHVEFCSKDALISEIRRVTKPAGKSVHIIESGYFPYETLDLMDRSDPRVDYVHLEGHVGMETAQELRIRWEKQFRIVRIENAMIWPIGCIETFLLSENREFAELVADFSADQRVSASIVLGWVNEELRQHIRRSSPEVLEPDHLSSNPVRRPSGLVYLVADH